jgi:hypothetical protein
MSKKINPMQYSGHKCTKICPVMSARTSFVDESETGTTTRVNCAREHCQWWWKCCEPKKEKRK